jgi:type III secretory pathway component EscT
MRSELLAQQLIAQLAFLAPERLLILLIIPALISRTSSPASARTGVACASQTPRTPSS